MSFIRNFFIPHKGNNYKAKLLHHLTLLLVIVFLISSTFVLNNFNDRFPQVLGISTDITSEQLLTLLNQKRQESSLHGLSLNPELSAAALQKANDMLAKNYWAHNAPDGKTPWEFIKESGYVYVYAGENLARGFTTSTDVTTAWMNSSSHKANLLSSNYTDVGFAIVTGTLDGEETVLVVQEFGGRSLAAVPKSTTQETSEQKPQEEAERVASESKPKPQVIVASSSEVKNKPIIDSVQLTTSFSIFLVAIVIFTLVSEMAILERRKIFNFAKHNPDHVIFLISIIILVFILGKGIIL